jgi:hypothetical protein
VASTTPAKLWALDRVTFRGIVAKASHAQHSRLKTTLRRGILESLTDEQLAKVAAYVPYLTHAHFLVCCCRFMSFTIAEGVFV